LIIYDKSYLKINIINYAKRLGVKLIKGITIIVKDDDHTIELLVLSPKDNKSLKFINNIISEQFERIIQILYGLHDYDIYLDPVDLIQHVNGVNDKCIHILTDKDIIEVIYEKYINMFNDEIEIVSLFSSMGLDRIYPDIETALYALKDCKVFIIDPFNYIDTTFKYIYDIYGLVLDIENNDCSEFLKQNNMLRVVHGSNTIL